jgi:hypothetical protein
MRGEQGVHVVANDIAKVMVDYTYAIQSGDEETYFEYSGVASTRQLPSGAPLRRCAIECPQFC